MKNIKSMIRYFMLISIICIGLLPAINFYGYINKYDFKGYSNSKFYKHISKFGSEKFFNTDKIERYLNYGFYVFFGRSLVENKVVIGKGNFLFLGSKHSNVIDKIQDHKKDIDKWTNKLKNVQDWYSDKGIRFVVVVAPDKRSVYRKKLPNWIDLNKATITDDILDYSISKNINILDLRGVLRKQITPQLYFSTDTHWNNKGAAIGYEETISYINKTYGIGYETVAYNFSESYRGGGDLARTLKISSFLPKDYEVDYPYVFDHESNICRGWINKDREVEEACSNKLKRVRGAKNKGQYSVNTSSVNNERLLYLHDSFAGANRKLYDKTFKTVWMVHYGSLWGVTLSNFIAKNKPDIVIYQVVERNLYKSGIVKKIPELSGQL
jgi:alginate O-acetyltransferase complex protein AlgJ